DGPLGAGALLTGITLRSGTHVLTASVRDSGGRSAAAEVTVEVNAAPTVRITGPADGSTFSPGEAITLAGTAADAEDGDLGAAIAWSSSLQGPLGAGGTLAGGTLGPGTHVLTASVTDGGGRSASATTTVVVAPLITLQGSRSTAYTNLSLAGKTKIDLTAAT